MRRLVAVMLFAAACALALNADSIANAASVAADGLEINGEIYASAEYRTHLVRVYTKRALTRAAGL